jgi:cytochrome c-type biogenesis protein CcmH
MRFRLAISVLALLMLSPAPAFGVSDPHEMLANPTLEQRAEQIGRQLRCLVCQNESIEDSGADLARDLRRIVRTQVAEGRTDSQVMAWMTARYGNFVRLAPPLIPATLLLWGMPVLALLIGFGIVLAAALRRRGRQAPPPPLTDAERRALAELTTPR